MGHQGERAVAGVRAVHEQAMSELRGNVAEAEEEALLITPSRTSPPGFVPFGRQCTPLLGRVERTHSCRLPGPANAARCQN